MLISIDEKNPQPIYVQIARQVKIQILSGDLRAEEELPSVRELAEAIGINLHTVHKAYQTLCDEGVIHVHLGRRARVANRELTARAHSDLDPRLHRRLKEWIVDAFLSGLSAVQMKRLVNEEIDRLAETRQPQTPKERKQENSDET
jgi:GntR family transcriptional regulator